MQINLAIASTSLVGMRVELPCNVTDVKCATVEYFCQADLACTANATPECLYTANTETTLSYALGILMVPLVVEWVAFVTNVFIELITMSTL